MKCRICHTEQLTKILDLGHQPPSDAFLTEEQLKGPEIYFPLDVWQCNECSLVQIGYVVSPHILFDESYPYLTGSNKEGIVHFRNLAKDVVEKYGKGLVVDIGGNDGTLAKAFEDLGCEAINVEPCRHIPSQVSVIYDFLNEETAQLIFSRYGPIDIITSTNNLAHVDNLHEYMWNIVSILNKDGVFIVEAPDWNKLIENMEYDTIYHEHLSYFTPESIEYLVKQYGMTITSIEEYPIHGGTNRYYIQASNGTP